jgi:hypothetical protein
VKYFSVLALGLLGCLASAQLTYTFDTNEQGWRRADFNPVTFQLTVLGSATWNSGGYIEGDDFSNYAFHLSPDLAGGYQNAPRIEFDYSTQFVDNTYPLVVLRGNSEAIFQNALPLADNLFHHYSYDFTPGTWLWSDGVSTHLATTGEINSVLTNLFQIGVSSDYQTGPDYTRLDNLTIVPEPITMITLGAGLLTLLKRRKK